MFVVPPHVNDELRNRSVALNSIFTTKCIVRGDPPISVNWTKNGVELDDSNSLVISHVTFEDKGIYECTAENQAGKVHASFWIDVTGKFQKHLMSIYKYRSIMYGNLVQISLHFILFKLKFIILFNVNQLN